MEIQDTAFLHIWLSFLILGDQSGLDFAAILNGREAEGDPAAGRRHTHDHKLSRAISVLCVRKIVELVSTEIFIADTDWAAPGEKVPFKCGNISTAFLFRRIF